MNDELIERMGQLIDTVDNFLAGAKIPVPAQIHHEGLTQGMKRIRKELFDIYMAAGGTDEWEGRDEE